MHLAGPARRARGKHRARGVSAASSTATKPVRLEGGGYPLELRIRATSGYRLGNEATELA